ncbi:MAG TPA: hypothetical protein V6D17_20590 [Candidatus Obscuribacterales bacterium]
MAAIANDQKSAPSPDVRQCVFEVVVRHALTNPDWKQICAGPMKVNNITVAEVETEAERRRRGGGQQAMPDNPNTPPTAPVLPTASHSPAAPICASGTLPVPSATEQLKAIRASLVNLGQNPALISEQMSSIINAVDNLSKTVCELETSARAAQQAQLDVDMQRELARTTKPIEPKKDEGPHPVKWKLT